MENQFENNYDIQRGTPNMIVSSTPSNVFEGSEIEVLNSIFGDMRSTYDQQQILKNNSNQINFNNSLNAIESKSSSFKTGTIDTENSAAKIEAKLNEQFIVWKDGQVGRMSVDTPFGYAPY